MISLDDITVAYGSFVLLDKINFHISETDKIGLVGKNGAGKSTLMKLICGMQLPTSGQIDKPNHISIGYLPQIMEHNRGRSVLEEAMSAFDSEKQMEKEIEELARELSLRSDYESDEYMYIATRLSDLNEHLVAAHSEPPEVQARKTLIGLGFKDRELSRLTDSFSEGWNMRIELAKLLLRQHDVLLLDEPTNHLDIESIEWLEDFLSSRKGSLLLVSHDRKFLDKVTNRTVEIVLSHIQDYKVPYSKYLELRAERMSQQMAAFENQQKMIEKTEEFIERFRYKATKSNQVQSRIKALEKLDRIEVDETDNATLRVKFPPSPRSGDLVYQAKDLIVSYPGKRVFSHAEIEIKRGEKVALIGRNGEGKTTLMRVITGELEPESGESRIGHNVDIGYFAQAQERVLDPQCTVFETLDRVAVGEIRTKIRDILAQFLFRGEDIDKKVAVLSGGERARLGMARLMLKSHNFLLLDEPTNHMDIKSKDILKQALMAYDGALLIVSHDRDFLDGLVDKFYEFSDGRVKEHLETVQEFLEKKKLESLSELDRKEQGQIKTEQKAAQSLTYEQQKAISRQERRLKEQIRKLEEEIEVLETKIKEIEDLLSQAPEGLDIMAKTQEYLDLKGELDAKTAQWFELQ
ncbi:MAG: ribosomal protection-like ABC-F family protein [Candidatus Cryptobacteroides sp.]